mgnify:CR=1 FL=1
MVESIENLYTTDGCGALVFFIEHCGCHECGGRVAGWEGIMPAAVGTGSFDCVFQSIDSHSHCSYGEYVRDEHSAP